MEFSCNICIKKYSSYKSLWNHNKKFHKNTVSLNNPEVSQSGFKVSPKVSLKVSLENTGNYKCSYCDNKYKHKQSKYKHEKKCNTNNEIIIDDIINIKKENMEMKAEMADLKDMLQKALKIHPKTLQKINNQLNNSGTINNTINIIQLGKEDLSKMLSMDEKMRILNRQAMGINDLVQLVHTSGKYKKCMNVYITNLQNTIGYMYDEKQNNFIAVNKNELLNDLLDSRMYDIEKFYEKLQLKFEPEKATKIKKFIDRMKNDEDCLKDLKKEEIKLILYNNREVISTILPKIDNKNIDLN
jgi:uncharacterized Zn-finger protein